jgi:thioesterase domain-containing protein
MIDPIRTTGSGLPVIMVHGLFGVMPIGQRMADALGPDHAFSALHARALTGSSHESVESMARDYLAEARARHPRGPYILGGMCAGALVALEMARQLRIEGEAIASVLMLEPNPVLNLNPPQRQLEPSLEEAAAGQIRQAARGWLTTFAPTFDRIPFDFSDPRQLEQGAEAGAKLIFAYERHRVQPYSGHVDIVASEPFAKLITNANLPWRKEILLGTWAIHTVPCAHEEVFARGAPALLETLRKIVRTIEAKAQLVRA